MTLTEAFNTLLLNWQSLPKEYREKYKSYKSKYENKSGPVGERKMKEMLNAAGCNGAEIWVTPWQGKNK